MLKKYLQLNYQDIIIELAISLFLLFIFYFLLQIVIGKTIGIPSFLLGALFTTLILQIMSYRKWLRAEGEKES